MSEVPAVKSMDAIMALCKRRGFVYQASDIYGGINGFWDYGPLGAQLKKNLRDAWWQDMILNPAWGRTGPNGERVRCVPLETCIIQHPKVWEASGHVGGFNDPMVDCRDCKSRFRADHVYGGVAWSKDLLFKDNPSLQQFQSDLSDDGLSYEMIRLLFTPNAQQRQEAYRELQPILDFLRRESRLNLPVVSVVSSSREEALEAAAAFVSGNKFFSRRGLQLTAVQPLSGWPTHLPPFPCPNCQKQGTLTEPRQFNLMFRTYVGATASEDDIAYLRPETAQGVFIHFKNVVDSSRVKVPFGIGNTGRSFRNEVTPRNFTFRSREFEQAELEFFCHPDESRDWYVFWRDFRMEWWKAVGLAGENLILREHGQDELSHYSQGTSDVEYRFPFTAPGFGELEGIAHRGCYDLTQHQTHSKVKLDYFDTTRGEVLPNGGRKGERYIPHCIEPAAGLDRGALALICEGYTVDPSRPSPEFLRLHPRIAPIKAAVFPLVDKDGMPEVAEKLADTLFRRFGHSGFIETDAKQSIGKRYARMDEAGCPYCFTVDGDTLKDQTVTVRDRDTGQQQRLALDAVPEWLAQRLAR